MSKAEDRVIEVTALLWGVEAALRHSDRLRRHELCASIYHAGGGKHEPSEFGNDGKGCLRARIHLMRVCLDRIAPAPRRGKNSHG